ncbi:MAG TPA: PilN domain-containing protein [Terriglobales bacterium]|nr:PilN domain-containing protein [Terriglobales bacterium]
MRLDINLATHPYEDVRRFWLRWGTALAGLGLFSLLLVLGVISAWSGANKDRESITRLEQQIAARDQQKQQAVAQMNLPHNREVRDRAEFLNALFERKSLSWTRVFEDLERVMPPHLHVVSIHPEMTPEGELELKLVVAGQSRDRAIELVRNMEDSQRFQRTQIEQEAGMAGQTNGDNVQFELSTFYIPGAEAAASKGGAP